jgi:hypothetical protein
MFDTGSLNEERATVDCEDVTVDCNRYVPPPVVLYKAYVGIITINIPRMTVDAMDRRVFMVFIVSILYNF